MTAKSAVNFGGVLVAGVFLSTSQQSVVNKKARIFGLFTLNGYSAAEKSSKLSVPTTPDRV